MKKLVKVQGFAKKLEGFKVELIDNELTTAVAIQNADFRITAIQNKTKLCVAICFADAREGQVIPAKNQAEQIKIMADLMVQAEEEKAGEFSPELTAIDTRHSKTAELVAGASAGKKVLDYGCGTGRNMRYIYENGQAQKIDGCDISDQLVYNKEKHDVVRALGMQIGLDTKTAKNNYELVINSHVLNVIESDQIKQLVLNNIADALVEGGTAFIEVRTKKDVEGAKTKIPYGEGFKIKCKGAYTYQEGITKEKMARMVENAGLVIEKHTCNSSSHLVVAKKIEILTPAV